ncbi:MAG TPA: acyl-CoA dehydrogenase family protein, partial [Bacillales bacterium]|nr:acyl-CoA dehydrogenase family protein [Bacillales bacterium]
VVDPGDCEIVNGENLAGEPRDEVTFNKVRITADSAAPTGTGVTNIVLTGALIRSVMMAGSLQRLLDLTVTYSKERTQFGRSIGRFQAVQQQLAMLAGETTAAQIAASAAIEAYEADGSEEAIMSAKIRAGEAASTAAPIAHQVHGAIGFTDEHALHQTTRRLWAWRDEFESESEWAKRLGQRVIEDTGHSLWSFMTNV